MSGDPVVRLDGAVTEDVVFKVAKPTPGWLGGNAKTITVATCEFPASAIGSGENAIRIGAKGNEAQLLAGEIFLTPPDSFGIIQSWLEP